MSLVAYAASDESDNSDAEEQNTSGSVDNSADSAADSTCKGKISDDDDYYAPSDRNNQTASSAGSSGSGIVTTPSSLCDLPAPKPAEPSPAALEGEDELEEEVKPKASQLADAPKPPAPRKTKQPARIVLPALQQDSDDEDDSSRKPKNPNPEKGGGLFSLLPPPVHASIKQTNRPLIPHTLTKRPAASIAKTAASSKTPTAAVSSTQDDPDFMPSQKHKSAFNALTGYESDSDEEESAPRGRLNFFSLDSDAQVSSSSGLVAVKNSAPDVGDTGSGDQVVSGDSSVRSEIRSKVGNIDSGRDSESRVKTSVGTSSAASTSSSVTTDVTLPTSTTSDDSADGEENDQDRGPSVPLPGVPVVNQDAPLKFSSTHTRPSWSAAPLVAPMMPEMYAAGQTSSMAPSAAHWHQQQHYAQNVNPSYEEEGASDQSVGVSGTSDLNQYMADEQFLRLAPGSGKRKRSQEDFEIIDAKVDDYVDPSELMKGITEESSYQPHRKKENMPSAQQRRKKQITYLAFQAKERELELKNQWSQNRMTKSHARSKYGF